MILKRKNRLSYLAGFVICSLLFTICSTAQSKLDVLVIDPGHGGKDPGTLNTVSGTQEKNIVLPIALKLGELIRARYPEIRVILTRDKDEFPSLKDRTKIANDNKAKLFISIHANHKKQEETDKSGFEIYVLNRERIPEAIGITMTENAMLQFRKAGTDTLDNFIFASLAQMGYLKYSEALATYAEINLLQYTQLITRGVMQQSLWVTVGPSMPSVLVETGYIDDPKDEKYLTSSAGQAAIANALFNAFASYKNLYESN